VLDAALLSYYESLPREVLRRYREAHSSPVSIDQEQCHRFVPRLMVRPLAAAGTLVRHDPDRLAAALLDVLAEHGRQEAETPEIAAPA
jgi:hypothetical protein